ncbi:MAG TPA: DNA repair and recombination protein RadB [Candidatus Thermoplasmatota archaeon]|nr:DNA repair and recombination protein RadB [Candidatus Thermoplasmatota archaeon]
MLARLFHTFKGMPDLGEADHPVTRLPIACPPLDELLHGGVETGAITEFFGEAGSGKTNLCLQLARNAALAGRKTIYIDTEGVSLERLAQMCGEHYGKVRERILFFEPYSLNEQQAVIEKTVRLAAGTPEIGLVILDSAAIHYRIALGTGDDVGGRRALAAQLHQLAGVARKRDIPVIITNQVFTNIETEELEPLGGQVIRHLAKAVVRVEKLGPARRKATILKHRSVHEGVSAEFRITMRGLAGEEEPGPLVAVWDAPGSRSGAEL